MRRRSNKSIYIAVSVVMLMFCFSFAMAPIYRVVCKRTGLNGNVRTPIVSAAASSNSHDNRSIQVQFVATNNQNLPWEFYPKTNCLDVQPKQLATVTFFAKNNSDHPMTVQAIPSFTPANAAQYFHKVECFCFTQQTLQPHEEKNMAVVFRLDSDMPEDMKTITLSYTLFNVPQKNVAVVKKQKHLVKAKKKKIVRDDEEEEG